MDDVVWMVFWEEAEARTTFYPLPSSFTQASVKGDQIHPEEGRTGKIFPLPFKTMPEPVTNRECSTEGSKQTSG
jgi:hypothetical protein